MWTVPNEGITLWLSAQISENEDSSWGNAASQDVEDDQEGKSRGCIVEQETEGIREWNAKNSKQKDDESQGSPGIMKKECFLIIKNKNEGKHDESWHEEQWQVPHQIGEPEHSW